MPARNIAFGAGEIANDAWTGGVIAHESRAGGVVTGSVFIVARDAQVAATGQILVTSYFIAAINMTMSSTWSGSSVGFGKSYTEFAGTGRCCGPTKACTNDNPTTGPSGCGPTGNCGDTMILPFGDGDVNLGRQAAGKEPISVNSYNQGIKVTGFCFPSVDTGCQAATPICGSGNDISMTSTTEAAIPTGNNCLTGGLNWKPVSGRAVPKNCTYSMGGSFATISDSTSVKYGGGHPLPECDGRCVECEASKAAYDANFRPRQCALIRSAQGSGICESTQTTIATEQARLHQLVGGPTATGHRCDPMPVSTLNPGFVGTRVCTVCDAAGCKTTILPSQILPFADTSTTCSATNQNSCPGTPGLATSSGTAGAGTTPGTGKVVASTATTTGATEIAAPPPARAAGETMPTNNSGQTSEPGPARAVKIAQQGGTTKVASDGDPVLLSDGSLELNHTDLSFPGPVRSLEFKRSYNSRSQTRSELGSNWSHNWDVRVVPLNDSNRPEWVDPFCSGSPFETTCLMLNTGAGQQLFTRDLVTGLFMPQAGVMSTFVKDDVGWSLRTVDGHVSQFDADGYMTRDEDRFGNAFTLVWEPNAAGLLFDALCPRQSTYVDASGSYVDAMGPGGVYTSSSPQCVLLSGLTGRGKPVSFGSQSARTLAFNLGSSPSPALSNAAALIVALQTGLISGSSGLCVGRIELS